MSLEQEISTLRSAIETLTAAIQATVLPGVNGSTGNAVPAKKEAAKAPAKGKTAPAKKDADDLDLDLDLDTPADDDLDLGDDLDLEEEPEVVSKADVLAVLKELSLKEGGRAKVAEILKKVAKVTEFAKVDAKHYAAVLVEAKKANK